MHGHSRQGTYRYVSVVDIVALRHEIVAQLCVNGHYKVVGYPSLGYHLQAQRGHCRSCKGWCLCHAEAAQELHPSLCYHLQAHRATVDLAKAGAYVMHRQLSDCTDERSGSHAGLFDALQLQSCQDTLGIAHRSAATVMHERRTCCLQGHA